MEAIETEDQLVAIVKSKGALKVVTYQGQETAARYWVHYLNESYVFVFENPTTYTDSQGASHTSNQESFKATYKFVLENLRIEDAESEAANSFKLELKPGDRLIKKLTRLDNAAESKYKCSFSYCFINMVSQE